MSTILKIQDFQKQNPTMYGLDADGSCYDVTAPFDLRIITGYEDLELGFKSGIKYKTPKWEKVEVGIGDSILCSKNGAFMIPKDEQGFIECKPMKKSGSQEPNFDVFPMDKLKKIGKNIFKVKSIPFEDRQKMTFYKGI